MNKSPSSYANKLSPRSLTKANLQKIKANVLNGDDYDIWLPLAYFHEINDQMKNYLYSYARILIEINAFNEFSDHSVMVVLNLEGNGYTKETIHIEYEWEPPRCSTCLIFGHSLVDFPKDAPKRVVNQNDKATGSKATTTGTQWMDKGPHVVDKINVVEKQILEGKIMFDDGKPLENVDCPDNLGSNDQVENKVASFLVSKLMGVRYGSKILLEQWRKNNVHDD
nr:hypothetical protein [Tanacetum cinerariifolium]